MSLTVLTKLAGLVLLLACTPLPFEPATDLVPGSYLVTPDSLMLAEYAKAEDCTGVKGDISRVSWYLVPGSNFPDPETGTPDYGWTDLTNHRIFLAAEVKNYGWMWKHEAIHEILNIKGHPNPPFGLPCHALWGYINQNGD